VCWTDDLFVIVTQLTDCEDGSLGVYEWSVHDERLDFTLIRDECFWRPHGVTIDSRGRLR
jgi:hypothetical protein